MAFLPHPQVVSLLLILVQLRVQRSSSYVQISTITPFLTTAIQYRFVASRETGNQIQATFVQLCRVCYSSYDCTTCNITVYCNNIIILLIVEHTVLSQSAIIAITMASTYIAAILLFFAIGLVCGCRYNQSCTDKPSDLNVNNIQIEESLPDVLYEDILPSITSQNVTVKMNQNTAYGPVKPVATS